MLQLLDRAKKTVLIYRFLRFRRGFGVHSPFAFNLITKVIDERCPFYCFDRIELIRKQIKHNTNNRTNKMMKPSHGELLFRLVNYVKPRRILQIGGDCISSLYYNAYSSGLESVLIKYDDSDLDMTAWALSGLERKVDIRCGSYAEKIKEAFENIPTVDFVFFNCSDTAESLPAIFGECLKHIHPDTVFFIEGIRQNRQIYSFWKEIKENKEVVLTFDMYNVGFVFFNKRLHRKDYIVYF